MFKVAVKLVLERAGAPALKVHVGGLLIAARPLALDQLMLASAFRLSRSTGKAFTALLCSQTPALLGFRRFLVMQSKR